MANLPKINSSHDGDTRNKINRSFDVINEIGRRVQDLVAEGQLTPSQYAQLISIVNGNVKKGNITSDDIDNNNFQLKQIHLSDELLQQMAGNTPVNAVPADNSLTTRKFADNSVTFDKTNFASQVAVMAKNMLENSGFTKDSDGDGLADGWYAGWNNEMNAPNLSNGIQYWTPLTNSNADRIQNESAENLISGHKYYISVTQKNIATVYIGDNTDVVARFIDSDGKLSVIFTAVDNSESIIRFHPREANTLTSISKVMVVDLTETFGIGKEPTAPKFEYMMSLLDSGDWFNGSLNFTDASKNGIVTADELKIFDPENSINASNVNDALLDLSDGAVKATPGKNIYNPENNVQGTLTQVSSGGIQSIEESDNQVSQKIKITNDSDVTLNNLVAYAITDLNDIVIKYREYVGGGERVKTIKKESVPEDEYFLWVSARENEVNSAQIEYSSAATPYEPYKPVSAVYANGVKLFDYPLEVDSDSVSASEFESAINRLENRMNQIEDSYLVPGDNQVIPLSNTTDSQKLILHLHRREKEEGFGTFNNAYVPNAKTDFSDIKITTEKGASLPYRMTHLSHDFDIVPYDWVRSGSMASATFMDSKGDLYQEDNYIRKSTDKGNTWTDVPAFTEFHQPNINLIAQDDTMYFNVDKKLYRSEAPYTNYQMVFDLDPNNQYDRVHITGKSLVQHPDGELFAGLYQTPWHIRIYKSTDNGLTWNLSVDLGDAYQHIHGMFVDEYTGAVYAGLDGGGGVLKTTDKGVTWVDLRDDYDIPQSTDYGVRYADPSGYRLLGGETPIVGGHSIIKTFDDENYYPVLSDGISVNYVIKLGNRMFATGSGSHGIRNGAIYISRDDAETWEGVYRTAPLLDLWSANDGYRYMEQISDNEILVGPQSRSRPPLRIFGSGNYAEIIVDVPAGTNSLTIESGHRESNVLPIANDSDFEGEKLVHFEMNENSTVIKELVSGATYEDNIEWVEGGKRLSYFNPDIRSSYDNKSALMHSLTGYEVGTSNFDTSQGITISFWAKISEGTWFTLMEDENGNTLDIANGLQLHLNNNNNIISFNFPIIPQPFIKHDILIRNDGNVSVYRNGIFRSTLDYSTKGVEVLDFISNSNKITFLSNNNANFEDAIQHFIVRKGIISEEQLLKESHADLSDNI